jgi:hypothetical protein
VRDEEALPWQWASVNVLRYITRNALVFVTLTMRTMIIIVVRMMTHDDDGKF